MPEVDDKAVEMLDLMRRTRDWFEALEASGVDRAVIAGTQLVALVERSIVDAGVPATAQWLRSMAYHVETHGGELTNSRNATKAS